MALDIHQVSDDLNRGSRRFMRINPAGDHVQVGIDAVKHGNPFPIDVFVSHADPAEMIANQLGHGAACIFGQLFQRLKFRVRKPDPQHVFFAQIHLARKRLKNKPLNTQRIHNQ